MFCGPCQLGHKAARTGNAGKIPVQRLDLFLSSFPAVLGREGAQTQLGVGNGLGMGSSHAQGRCHLREWDRPVPRGGVTFGLGGCLPKSWMEFWEPLSRMGWAGVGSGRGCVHTEGHTGAVPARGHGWRGQGTSLGQLPQLWEGALPLDPDLNPGIPLPLVSWNNLGGKGPFQVTKSNPTSSIFTPCLTYQRRRPR